MFKKDDFYFTSNDFSSFADLVYADRVPLEKAINKSYQIIEYSKNPNFLCYTYKRLNFKIHSGTTIFCNSHLLDNLFFHLKKNDELSNINLITHQTDTIVSKKLFDSKPRCIDKWFSVNVEYEHSDLIPIPIGIASNFSLKNLTIDDFKEFNQNNFLKKDVRLYANFNVNTNFAERKNILKELESYRWVTIDNPTLNKSEYIKNISNSSFVLCPWGNGVDTHRFWEALYCGSIPITKYHPTYKAAKDLPVVFVNDYKDITYELLKDFLERYDSNNYNFEKLTISYWGKLIRKNKVEDSYIIVNESFLITNLFNIKRLLKNNLKSLSKKLINLLNKISKKLGF